MNFLLFIVIGCVAGFIAGKLMRGGGFGLIVNLILGVIGGIFGGWVLGLLGIDLGMGLVGQLLTSVIGAALILFIASLFKK
jgi:uncharacterized membrane protein YeaQ/YmgE (transglycosylase-associated protein family)